MDALPWKTLFPVGELQRQVTNCPQPRLIKEALTYQKDYGSSRPQESLPKVVMAASLPGTFVPGFAPMETQLQSVFQRRNKR